MDELQQFFLELREQRTYPIVQGNPILLLYDLLCTLGLSERTIYNLLGVRGYLHVARNRFVEPGMFNLAIIGARVCYLPPAQPWRNGRLERFHWTMTREYWATQKPKLREDAETGLVEYLNWYNHQRIHTALGFETPASVLLKGGAQVPQSPYEFWREAVRGVPSRRALEEAGLSGTIECIRLVGHEGIVKLWQSDTLRLPPILAGQYVRLEFDTKVGEGGIGRAIWRGKEAIVVAEFTHRLSVGGTNPLIGDIRWRDFGAGKAHEDYDELEYTFGYAKRQYTRRPKRSE